MNPSLRPRPMTPLDAHRSSVAPARTLTLPPGRMIGGGDPGPDVETDVDDDPDPCATCEGACDVIDAILRRYRGEA